MKSIELFSDKYPIFSPTYVNQGIIGDCWLIATLLSLSINEHGKELLKDIFFINNDCTYTIKLYTEVRKVKYINIKPIFKVDTDENNNLKFCYSGSNYNIPQLFGMNPDTELIWVPIIEKAFSKYVGNISKLNGNYALNAYTALTNKEVKKIFGYSISKRMLDKFINDFNNNSICAVIETKNTIINTELVENHAYCLYKIIDGKWYLINPHEYFNGVHNCVVISQEEILKDINLISYIIF
jgi:hypothetical protein